MEVKTADAYDSFKDRLLYALSQATKSGLSFELNIVDSDDNDISDYITVEYDKLSGDIVFTVEKAKIETRRRKKRKEGG